MENLDKILLSAKTPPKFAEKILKSRIDNNPEDRFMLGVIINALSMARLNQRFAEQLKEGVHATARVKDMQDSRKWLKGSAGLRYYCSILGLDYSCTKQLVKKDLFIFDRWHDLRKVV